MNEKYLAGLLDADGHISVRARLDASPDMEISLAQATAYRDALDYAQAEFGGAIRLKHDGKYAELQLRSGPARKCAERLKKYMVLKRHHAELMLELVDTSPILRNKQDIRQVRDRVKEIRAYGASRLPNYPARKWLAGYFDGDGSFTCKVCRKTGYAYPHATILAAKNYVAGIVLLQQAFGGRINAVGENAVWTLQLSQPSKAKKFLDYFAKHLYTKRGVAYFIRACAEHNFRDGINIRDAIKALNSQQHRLSEPEGVAARFVEGIDFSIPKRRQGRPPKRQSNLQV